MRIEPGALAAICLSCLFVGAFIVLVLFGYRIESAKSAHSRGYAEGRLDAFQKILDMMTPEKPEKMAGHEN